MFYDIESGELVTLAQLEKEFSDFKKADSETYDYSFSEYIENCMTRNNGTLEKI